MGGLVCALSLPENFSTAALLLADILAVMIVGKIPLKYIGTTLGVMAIVGATGFFVLTGMSDSTAASISKLPGCKRVATWRARLETKVSETTKTVNPDDFDIDENSQIGHSSIAIATSNIIGKGPGHSVQRDFLPQAYSDFIYSVIVEEWGLIGAVFVVMLYLILLVRVGYITKRFRNSTFEPILAMGLAILLVSQAMLNMMVATGLFPVTGQPLPLISRGGTSTIVNCVYMGMILSVSRISKREAASAAKAAARKAAAAAVPAGDAGDAAVPDTNEEIPPAEVTAREIAAADFGDEDEKEST
jgi:cell division protein FtsW